MSQTAYREVALSSPTRSLSQTVEKISGREFVHQIDQISKDLSRREAPRSRVAACGILPLEPIWNPDRWSTEIPIRSLLLNLLSPEVLNPRSGAMFVPSKYDTDPILHCGSVMLLNPDFLPFTCSAQDLPLH